MIPFKSPGFYFGSFDTNAIATDIFHPTTFIDGFLLL